MKNRRFLKATLNSYYFFLFYKNFKKPFIRSSKLLFLCGIWCSTINCMYIKQFPVNTSTVSSSVSALLHCCLHCNVVSQCIGVEITKKTRHNTIMLFLFPALAWYQQYTIKRNRMGLAMLLTERKKLKIWRVHYV